MKPIVKLVRAVTLKPGDEYFTFKGEYHRRVVKTTPQRTKKTGMGVIMDTFWPEDRRPGKVCYGANARVYKLAHWPVYEDTVYAKLLHVRQQKEINELKSMLQDSMDSCGKYQVTINSLREECELKAQAIDELNAALAEKARGNAALNGTICGLRHKLTKANNAAAEQYNLNTRLHGVVEDITQRLEDFRDGE